MSAPMIFLGAFGCVKNNCDALDLTCHPALFALAPKLASTAYATATGQFLVMRFEPQTSALTVIQQLSGIDCAAPVSPPGGAFLYCGGFYGGNNVIYAFSVDRTGTISLLNTYTVPGAAGVLQPVLSDLLVISEPTTQSFWTYAIDPATGLLTLKSQGPATTGGAAATLDRAGRYVYGRLSGSNIYAHSINNYTVSQIQNLGNPGTNTFTFTTTPDKALLVYGLNTTPSMRYHTIQSDGTLGTATDFPGSTTNHLMDGYSWTPNGRFMYYGAQGGPLIGGYSYSNGQFAHISGGTIAAVAAIQAPSIDPTGSYAFYTATGSSTYFVYSIDPVTGNLTPVADSPRPNPAAGMTRITLIGRTVLGRW